MLCTQGQPDTMYVTVCEDVRYAAILDSKSVFKRASSALSMQCDGCIFDKASILSNSHVHVVAGGGGGIGGPRCRAACLLTTEPVGLQHFSHDGIDGGIVFD